MGPQQSKHSVDEMTRFLDKTPFYVYMTEQELKEFAKCFTVKKVSKGAVVRQTGEMYIVAQGEIQMTTMLDDTTSE